VTATITAFRENVAAVVQQKLRDSGLVEDGFQVVPGKLEGTQTDYDRGSVWLGEVATEEDNRDLETIAVRVRVFKRFTGSRGADLTPFDPTPLEAIMETLQTAFNGVQAAQGVWYLEFVSADLNELLDDQGVEVVFRGRNENLYQTTS
jgi:hypothetical protein